MKIDTIYFDIDGVLADFERGVMEICGMMPPSQNDKRSKADKDNEMWEKIKEVNQTIPHYKRVTDLYLTEEPFIKTTSLKIKRKEQIKRVLDIN